MSSPAFLFFKSSKKISRDLCLIEKVTGFSKADVKIKHKFGFYFTFTYRDLLADFREQYQLDSTIWIELYGYRYLTVILLMLNFIRFKYKMCFEMVKFYLKKNRRVLVKYVNRFVLSMVDYKDYEFEKKKNNIYVNNLSTIVENEVINEFTSKKRCYFASFSKTNQISLDLIKYLDKIKSLGFDIVFVTTSNKISVENIEKLKKVANVVVRRKNIGHDFGSWVTGILKYNPKSLDQVLIANDSVHSFPNKFEKAFNMNRIAEFDIYGVTSSFQINYHLQSYFIFFNKKVLESGDFLRFWENYKLVLIKDLVILNGEISLTQYFKRKGYKIGCVAEENQDYGNILHKRIDPMQSCWKEVIVNYNVPFIKKSLVNLANTDQKLRKELEIKLGKDKLSDYLN